MICIWRHLSGHSSVCLACRGRSHFTVKAIESHRASEEALESLAPCLSLRMCLAFTATSVFLLSTMHFSPTSLSSVFFTFFLLPLSPHHFFVFFKILLFLLQLALEKT